MRRRRKYRLAGRYLAFCAFLVIGSGDIVTAQSQYRVIGYYPMWSRSALPAVSVRYRYLTHIIHAFAWPNADGSIAYDEAVVDTSLINETHRQGRKILLSFGGAGGTQTANFALVAGDSVLRRHFIENVVSHLAEFRYDGADIDWEGPVNAADRANQVLLMRDLRAAFREADTTRQLTMAIGVTAWSGQWNDFANLKQYVDWFNAMTYDFHGSWSAHAGHVAPLYAPAFDANDGSDDLGIKYLNGTRGIPGGQIALGLPFYGRRWQTAGLFMGFSGVQDIAYADAMGDFGHNWVYTWDTVSQVPFLVAPSKTQLDTFDDSTSLTLKCNYAKSHNLSGVMIWALGQDLWLGGQPLMDAVGRAMSPATGVRAQSPSAVAEGYALYPNYPNPFNPSTTVRYSLARRSPVSLIVYDALGQEVARLVNGVQDAGLHEARFDAAGLASGVYFCRIRSGEYVRTTTMLLLR